MDCIDRKALRDALYDADAITMNGVKITNQFPSADVAPVRYGRWRWVAYDASPKIGNWHCTYCNRIPKSFQKEDFCPNRGAKMDKEEQSCITKCAEITVLKS